MKFNQCTTGCVCHIHHNQSHTRAVAKRQLKLVFRADVAHDVNSVNNVYTGHISFVNETITDLYKMSGTEMKKQTNKQTYAHHFQCGESPLVWLVHFK